MAVEEEHNKDDSNDDRVLIEFVPFDITIEILSRLPLESLLRFQYVSKTWLSIIRSKYFIKSSPRLIISFKNGTNPGNLFFFTSSLEDKESSSLVINPAIKRTSIDDYFYTRCASVNGFICLSRSGRAMIFNAITRQVITLPEIKGNKWKHTYKYLGYDPVNDKYKVLCKIASRFEKEHKVLTIGSDKSSSSWKHVQGTSLDYIPLTNGICINGIVYYGASTRRPDTRRVIICFDVGLEKLSFIIPPWQITIDSESTLVNYKGKLAIIDEGSQTFYLWVLEDVKQCKWSRTAKEVQISWWDSSGERGTQMYCPGINKIGEIIISPKFLPSGLESFYILYYNVESGKVRKVQLEGIADDEDCRRRYGIGTNGDCQIHMWPDHGENVTFI